MNYSREGRKRKVCDHLREIPSIWCVLQKAICHADNKEGFSPDSENLWSPFFALITHILCHGLTALAENSKPVINHASLHIV